jgi:hypothetical protein
MTKSGFSVIGELYRFLGEFDQDAILAARHHRNISPNIRIALEALAREARNSKGTRNTPASAAQRAPLADRTSLSSDVPTYLYRKNLLRFLSDHRRFPTKDSLVQFARHVGISDEISSKFGRPRVAARLARLIADSPALRDAVSATVANIGDAQTEGWMNLILRER